MSGMKGARETAKRTAWTALAAALAAALLASRTWAQPSANLAVTVTVNASLSLNLGGMSVYNFGAISASTEVVSTAPVVVTNDSGGLVEDYTITSSTFVATAGPSWTVTGSTSAAQDQFALCAAISPFAMTVSSFTTFGSAECFQPGAQSGAETYMNTSQFGTGGIAGTNTNGDHVPSGGVRDLWLYFASPTSMTAGNGVQQSLTVTLTANAASLFP